MQRYQRTLAQPVSCSGIGLHSGKPVHLTVLPAPVNQGIKFIRTDLPNSPGISAHFNRVVDTSLATVIGYDGFIVSTIEHMMATFSGLSIDNASVEIDCYEVPVMDGSAGPFTRMIRQVGIIEQDAPRHFFVIKKPIILQEQDKLVAIHPATTFKITCTIEFAHPLIRKQSFSFCLSDDAFEQEISHARTFGFYREVEYLKRYGLARGGSLDNAVVVDDERILNEDGLRYADEFVRHKLLDCIGDFSLLGLPVLGHLVVHKSGHAFNHAFLEKFFAQKDAWETRTLPHSAPPLSSAAKALAI